MYASSWFLTLFLTFLPLPVATRIFDIFMYEVGNILMCLTVCVLFTNVLFQLRTYNKVYNLSVGPRDYLPCGPGHPAVQPDWPHSAGHGGHVAGKQPQLHVQIQPRVKRPVSHFPFCTRASWTTDLLHSVTTIQNRNRNQGTFSNAGKNELMRDKI